MSVTIATLMVLVLYINDVPKEWMGIMNDHGILEETYEIFKRAGTDYLITYGARQLLNK